MDLWAQEHVEALGPALIRLERDGAGEISFLCVRGWLDCEPRERDGRLGVEFSWEGEDDGDHRCGRGWLRLAGTDSTLDGHFYFHRGDSSAFKAERISDDATLQRRTTRGRRR
jgi:hypothetical protein